MLLLLAAPYPQMRFPTVIALCAFVLAFAGAAWALTEEAAFRFESYTPRLGSPVTSNTVAALQPRFHRILGHTSQSVEAGKAQTALFSVTDANVVGAVNPRNGAIVWRQHLDSKVQGMWLDADVALVASGQRGQRWHLFHALTGFTQWSRNFAETQASVNTSSSPPHIDASWLPIIEQARWDVITLTDGDTVRRIDTESGKDLWRFSRRENGEDSASWPSVRVLTSSSTHVHVVSLTNKGGLQHQVLAAQTGVLLATSQIPDASVQSSEDVSFLSLNPREYASGQSSTVPPEPHVVWRQTDGTLRSVALPLPPLDAKSSATKLAQPQSLSARNTADAYSGLREVNMANEGYLVATRASGRGEVVQLKKERGGRKLLSLWEFEEEALDAVYAGNFDRRGSAYINRVYFSSSQHLLNFHVFWANTNNDEGQVTGFSFRWDHDMHGDVLAAPFEVSPVSAYQLVTRAGLATRSGALQMVQEDRHQWINEEGLTSTQHVAFVDLPRRARPSGSDLSSEEALQLLQREGILGRLVRHANAARLFPAWVADTAQKALAVARGDKDLPSTTTLSAAGAGAATTASAYDDLPPPPVRAGLPAKDIAPPPKQAPAAAGLTKAERTKAMNRAKVEEEQPVDSVGPRTITHEEASARYFSDKWGLRQFMISATKKGKLYAQDTGAKSQFVWEKSLVGFGTGEGSPTPEVDVKYIGVVRDLQVKGGKQLDPLMYVVAEVEEQGAKLSQVWEVEPLTGDFVEGAMTGKPLFVGSVRQVRKLKGQHAIAAVDESLQVHLWPQTPETARAFAARTQPFHYVDTSRAETLIGYEVRSNATTNLHALQQTWAWSPPGDERVLSTHSSSILTDAPIAALGRELNDWFLTKMHKLLDPAALVVVTRSPLRQSLAVYLIDQSTGNVLHSLIAPGRADVSRGAHVTFHENWLTLAYTVQDGQGDVNGGRVLSMEYYDASAEAERSLSNWLVRAVAIKANVNSKDAKVCNASCLSDFQIDLLTPSPNLVARRHAPRQSRLAPSR